MIKKILLFAALTGSLFSYAQKKAKPETFAKSITADALKKQLYVIASPEMKEGKPLLKDKEKQRLYRKSFPFIGLVPGNNGAYQMKYPVYKDSIISSSLK